MSRCGLYIATPSLGQAKIEHTDALAQLLIRFMSDPPTDEFGVMHRSSRGCHLPGQRDSLVDDFLHVHGATHLLFIDDDISFESEAFYTLFKRDLPMIGANYPYRRLPIQGIAMWSEMPIKPIYSGPGTTGIDQPFMLGLGFTLIKREVLINMKKPRFLFEYVSTHDGGDHGTEDRYFCMKVRELGFPVYVDHDASKMVTHWGLAGFSCKNEERNSE